VQEPFDTQAIQKVPQLKLQADLTAKVRTTTLISCRRSGETSRNSPKYGTKAAHTLYKYDNMKLSRHIYERDNISLDTSSSLNDTFTLTYTLSCMPL